MKQPQAPEQTSVNSDNVTPKTTSVVQQPEGPLIRPSLSIELEPS